MPIYKSNSAIHSEFSWILAGSAITVIAQIRLGDVGDGGVFTNQKYALFTSRILPQSKSSSTFCMIA